MDHYANYTLRDFIQDESFIQWVKYPDAESTKYWESVRSTYGHLSAVIDKAADIVNALSTFYPEVPDAEIEKGREAIFEQYRQQRSFPIQSYLAIAASVIFLLGFTWWWFKPEASVHFARQILSPRNNEKEISNNTETTKLVISPDGSAITLSPKSSIRYEIHDDHREVYLDGEAYFDVVKNAKKPFYVFSNGLTTKVLGTRFKVSAYSGDTDVKVEVSSGRVSVYSNESGNDDPEKNALILTPNQRAVYSKKDLQLTRLVVEEPKVLIPKERLESYVYTNTPISQIFEGLEEIYGIKVIYDAEKFKDCKLNMVLSDESLFEKLELIGKVVEARYNVIDGQVIFIGDGCSDK